MSTQEVILAENNVRLSKIRDAVNTLLQQQSSEKTVTPDFADGDCIVLPEDGKLLSKVTIAKPDTLTPENIADGAQVAGVFGTYKTPTEEAVVSLDFSDGDQIVTSGSEKPMSQVTIIKPTTLKASNIRKGTTIAGITGTLLTSTTTALQYKTGTFTPSHSSLGLYPITVSGLGFTPKYVSVFLNTNASSAAYDIASTPYVLAFEAGLVNKHLLISKFNDSYSLTLSPTGAIEVSLSNGGFTLNSSLGSYIFTKSYRYIAIG